MTLSRSRCKTVWEGVSDGTLASIYKERWQIELFFKALKQDLKIKTFAGTTGNALHIQIWTALAAMLRLNLFTCRDLRDWLRNPFGTPPIPQVQSNSTPP